MSEANNYVCFNVDQSGNHSEPTRLRARNNIGAAGLSSLAASFESRAPSYNWSVNEVCTYGGKLWMFDSNHSGNWTGADVHEITIFEMMQLISSTWDDITNKLSLSDTYVLENNSRILINRAMRLLSINFSVYMRANPSTSTWATIGSLTEAELAAYNSGNIKCFSNENTHIVQFGIVNGNILCRCTANFQVGWVTSAARFITSY